MQRSHHIFTFSLPLHLCDATNIRINIRLLTSVNSGHCTIICRELTRDCFFEVDSSMS